MDLWVVQEVIDWMNLNLDVFVGIDILNVNFLGVLFSDDCFMLDLENLLRLNQVLILKICFEVIEIFVVVNLYYVVDFMCELK